MDELAQHIQQKAFAAGGVPQLASKIGLSAKKVSAVISGEVYHLTLTDIAMLATGLSLPFARIVSMAGFVSDKQGRDIQERIAALIRTIPMMESQFAAADFLTPDDLEAIVTYLEALQYRVKSST